MDNFGIGDIISPALKLAFKHKILWIFALFITAGSFGNTGNISNSFNSTGSQTGDDYEYNEQLDSESFDIEDVLGVASNIFVPTSGLLELPDFEGLAQQYSLNIFIVVVSFVVVMIFMIILGMIIKNWALGSLLGGTLEGSMDRKYTLFQLSTYGRGSVKELIKYSIFIMILTLLPMIVVFIPIIIAAVTDVIALVFVSILLMIPAMFYVLYLSLIGGFATRFVVFKKLGYREAFKQGRVLLHANFWMSLGLGIINNLLGGFIVFITLVIFFIAILVIGIPAVAVVAASEFDPAVIAMLALPAFILFMVVGLITVISKAFVTTYKKFAWTIFFNHVSMVSAPKEVTSSLVEGENEK